MKIKTTLLVMAILTSISCNALNYFWVGGSGNWSDFNNHWATTSGGSTFHTQVPQSTDNVYFDALSFTAAMPTVTIDQTIVQCADMTWIGVFNTPTLLGASSDTMRIFGSLALSVGMNFNFNGQVSMEGITPGNTISSAGNTINGSLAFNGIGGSWNLSGVLSVTKVIYLNNGTLNTYSQTINAAAFYSSTTSNRAINMGFSTFNLSGNNGNLWSVNPVGMTLNAGTSTINGACIGTGGRFYGGGFTYNDLFFTGSAVGILNDNNTLHNVSFAADGIISGTNTFHDVSFSGNANIYGDPMFGPNRFNNITMAKNGTFWSGNIFNNLSFSPGYTYTLQSGQIQSVGGIICAQGTAALPIRIQSSSVGSPTTILKPSGTICWDYVRVSDIAATGGATFNAGIAPTNSQDLGGNTGLLFTGGCTFSCTSNPAPCTLIVSASAIGSTVTVTANGGTPPYTGTGTFTVLTSGVYSYTVTDMNGCTRTATVTVSTSSPCTPPGLTMNPTPTIVCAGNIASFSVMATGTNLTYQWQVNPGAGFSNLFNNISYNGVTTNTLSITGATTALNGYQYRCVVSSDVCVSTSGSGTLTVTSCTPCTPPIIMLNPTPVSACVGSTTSFSVMATGTNLTYQWQVNQGMGFTNLFSMIPYTGVTTSLLSITGVTPATNGYQYRCLVSSDVCVSTSAPAILTVTSCAPCTPPMIMLNPNPVSVCAGSTTSFSVMATGTNLTYQWQVNPGAGFSNLFNTIPYNGVTTSTLSIIAAPTWSNGYQYRCVVSSGTCTSTSTGATLSVNPSPIVTVNSAAICAGQTAILTATIGSNMMDNFPTGTENYSWSTGATTNSISVSPAATTNYTVTVTRNGCSSTTIATVKLNLPPTVTVNSATICSGQTALLTATVGTIFIPLPPTTPPPAIPPPSGTTPPPPIPLPATLNTYLWSNGATTNSISVSPATTTTYTVTITNSGCTNTAVGTVTVNPLPIVTASVSASTVTVSAIGGTPPYTGTGTFTGLAQGTYSYSVTDANGCVGSTTAIVNSRPIPNFNISADTVYVGSSLTFINISTGFSPTTKFTWKYDDVCFTPNGGPDSGFPCVDTITGFSSTTHTYRIPGTFNVVISAEDLLGNVYSYTKSVVVVQTVCTFYPPSSYCNYVKNTSFEAYNICPCNLCGIELSCGWTCPTSAVSNQISTDFFNTCAIGGCGGSHLPSLGQNARTGNGCAAIIAHNANPSTTYNYKEYIQQELIAPLIAGKVYYFEMYVSLSLAYSNFSADRLGVYISTTKPSTNLNILLSVTPSIVSPTGVYLTSTGWTKISGCYTASGGQKFITIGKFTASGIQPFTNSNFSSSFTPQSYYFVDDVSLKLLNPNAGEDQTIACNQQATLGDPTVTCLASGATYSWSPSTGLNNPNIISPIATPNVTTTYTLTTTLPSACSVSESVTVNVTSLPTVTASAASTQICVGSSTQLIALSNTTVSYNWQPATGLNNPNIFNPIASPIVTTTYTVTVTNSTGCTKTAQVTVVVIPKSNFQVTGSTISCAASSYAVTPIQAGVSYTWTTTTGLSGTGSSTFINFNPTGGTITFTGTYGGCSSSNSLYVGSCCNPPSNNIPNQVNSTASLLIAANGTGGTITGKQFSINGTFLVDQNLTLKGCTVTMGYLAKITVASGRTLTITDDKPLKSHIYACNEMWDGIYVQYSNSFLEINNGTTIEDALNAVVSENKGAFRISSTIALGNVIFNKNYKSVVVKNPLNASHPGSISSTTIQCYDFVPGVTPPTTIPGGNPATTNDKLHYPHTTKRSDVGVEITDVFGITIGDPLNVANVNTFDNLDNGIRTNNASVNVYNNNFKTITGTGSLNECFPGIAICATGKNLNTRTLKVGSNLATPSYRNTFFNCYGGIYANTFMHVAIWNNTFTNIRNTAIRMKANYGRSLTANKNTINYANIGIDSYDNRGSYITINDNVISAGLFASNEQGIRAGEIVKPSPPTAYNILNNVISNVRWGINASGLSSSFINTNIVNIKHAGGQPCYGISLTNSTMSNVVGNVVKGQNKIDNWVNGIYLNLCNVSTVSCNTSDKLYTGLFFGGVLGATSTSIKKNLMNNNFRGLMLSSAVVGTQGAVGSPNDNRWTNITAGNYHTYSLNSIGANSKFYVRNATGPYNPSPYLKFAAPTTGFFVPLQPTSGNLNSMTCPVIHSTGGGGGAGSPKAMALKIAGDSIVPMANSASTKWMLKQGLYNYLQTDSSLVSTEPLVAQFKTYHSQHNLGKLQATEKILGDPLTYNTSALQTAQTLNNTVSPSSDAETNSQWMNNLLIDNALSSIDFTGAQLTDLRVLATKCPYSDGTAVFQARTILSQYDTVDYINECEMELPDNQRSMIIQEQAQDTTNTEFKLYPNPNNGNMQLDYSLNATDKGDITIYDIAGKLIYKYDLDASASQIIISHTGFNNGIYFYRIKVNNKIVKSDKLIIIK